LNRLPWIQTSALFDFAITLPSFACARQALAAAASLAGSISISPAAASTTRRDRPT
jgi:hypothetical protein